MLTRKRVPEALSWMNNRQLGGWQGALVAASDWPGRFPTLSKASVQYHQIESGTSIGSRVFVDLVIASGNV